MLFHFLQKHFTNYPFEGGEEMTEWERMSIMAETYKMQYPVGTRVLLLHMGDDPRPIPPNTRGTVRTVDSLGTVHCSFDNGRQLGLVPGEDSFRKLTAQELAEEQGTTQNTDAMDEDNGLTMEM